MRGKPIAAAFAVAVSLSACQQASDTVETQTADLDALQQIRDQHVEAVLTQSVDEELATYSDSAVVIPPNDEGAVGEDEVRAWLQGFFDRFNVEKLDISFEHYTLQEELAVAHYRYSWIVAPKGGGEPVQDTGQGLFVFERQPEGAWMIAYDIWNSDGASETSN